MREFIVLLVYVFVPLVVAPWALFKLYRVYKTRQRFNHWVKNTATKVELLSAQVGKMEFVVSAAGSLFSLRACFFVQAPDAFDDFGFFALQQEVDMPLGKRSCETADALAEFVLTTFEELDCDLSNNWASIGGLCYQRLRSAEFQSAKFIAKPSKRSSGRVSLELVSNRVIIF